MLRIPTTKLQILLKLLLHLVELRVRLTARALAEEWLPLITPIHAVQETRKKRYVEFCIGPLAAKSNE